MSSVRVCLHHRYNFVEEVITGQCKKKIAIFEYIAQPGEIA